MPKEKFGIKLREQYDRKEIPDELLSKFRNKFESGSNPVMGKIVGNHVFSKYYLNKDITGHLKWI